MSHSAKISLTVDIEHDGKILFKDKTIYFYVEVELYHEWNENELNYVEVQNWHSDDVIKLEDRVGYSYSLIMKEWTCTDKEVENFDQDIMYKDLTLLVKSEDYSDIEIDYGQFEPDYDMTREGK